MNDNLKKAAALQYAQKSNAPKIIASGTGFVANQIVNKAEEFHIPVIKDDLLADRLVNVQIGQEIPTELYEVVAQIYVFLMDIDKSLDGYTDGVK